MVMIGYVCFYAQGHVYLRLYKKGLMIFTALPAMLCVIFSAAFTEDAYAHNNLKLNKRFENLHTFFVILVINDVFK